jgi:hypothetical protein
MKWDIIPNFGEGCANGGFVNESGKEDRKIKIRNREKGRRK